MRASETPRIVIFRNRERIIEMQCTIYANDVHTLGNTLKSLQERTREESIFELEISERDPLVRAVGSGNFMRTCNRCIRETKIVMTKDTEVITDKEKKKEIVKTYHDNPIFGGHPGKRRMTAKIAERFYWKGMSKDIAKYCKGCHKCQVNKSRPGHREEMTITTTPMNPFDLVIVDTIGPLKKTENGNVYAVTMIDVASKYLIIAPTRNKTAEEVAKAIVDNCILTFGPMRTILSDRGTEFINETMEEICKLLEIGKKSSTAYHHETLGAIERNHRVLNEYLRGYVHEQQMDWDTYVRYFAYCYNVTPHTSFQCKFSPYELLFGRKPITPEILLDGRVDPVYNFEDYSRKLKNNLQAMGQLARKMMLESKEKNKRILDEKSKSKAFKFEDAVLLQRGAREKVESVYEGPYFISEIRGANAMLVDDKEKFKAEVHKNRLIQYHRRNDQ